MEFDKSKVYTALNADESLIGAKGYFEDNIFSLTQDVEQNLNYRELTSISSSWLFPDDNTVNGSGFNFFYFVEPAPEKWFVTYTKDKEHFSTLRIKFKYETDDVLFEGSKEECEQWVEEQSKKKK